MKYIIELNPTMILRSNLEGFFFFYAMEAKYLIINWKGRRKKRKRKGKKETNKEKEN